MTIKAITLGEYNPLCSGTKNTFNWKTGDTVTFNYNAEVKRNVGVCWSGGGEDLGTGERMDLSMSDFKLNPIYKEELSISILRETTVNWNWGDSKWFVGVPDTFRSTMSNPADAYSKEVAGEIKTLSKISRSSENGSLMDRNLFNGPKSAWSVGGQWANEQGRVYGFVSNGYGSTLGVAYKEGEPDISLPFESGMFSHGVYVGAGGGGVPEVGDGHLVIDGGLTYRTYGADEKAAEVGAYFLLGGQFEKTTFFGDMSLIKPQGATDDLETQMGLRVVMDRKIASTTVGDDTRPLDFFIFGGVNVVSTPLSVEIDSEGQTTPPKENESKNGGNTAGMTARISKDPDEEVQEEEVTVTEQTVSITDSNFQLGIRGNYVITDTLLFEAKVAVDRFWDPRLVDPIWGPAVTAALTYKK